MADVTLTGTVDQLKIQQMLTPDDVLQMTILVVRFGPNPGDTETFMLWDAVVADQTSAGQWIARSLNVSLLREALVNKLKVTIHHDSGSNIVHGVVLLGS